MIHLLPSWPLLAAFIAASFALAVTPGPGVLYVVTRSLAQGRRDGLVSVAGVALGNWCNALGAVLGLAALFAVSAAAFTLVKLAGAVYLVYLGAKTLRGPRADAPTVAGALPLTLRRVFRDGFFVALLNPKTAVFFAAFLPQFMAAGAHPGAQGVLLGSLFVAIAAVTDAAYAIGASAASVYVARSRWVQRSGRVLTGSALIGLGVLAAVTGVRKPV
jgi:threonine/homoserine/homoserine lactone efflux protein